jgi:carbon-monoxide dehydrogenase small subunit
MAKKVHVETTINGEGREFLAEPRQSLLDGVLVNSCCVLGVEAQGRTVETIEGLGTAENLHPLQKAFIEETGMQCGICTPGFLMASKSLLQSNPNPTEEEVRLWLAGNLCRCTGYDKLVRAVLKAGKEMEAA